MDKANNQFKLLQTLRFAPFFWTQFLGAFNDNLFKNALIILITYQVSHDLIFDVNTMVNICSGLFILPYFLFSGIAGQIADKYEKSMLIRYTKILEIIIMAAVCLAFYFFNVWALVSLLFLLGVQATLFGPVKYSILPQHLKDTELVGGNGLVSMGTFSGILLGTILGGVLISLPLYGQLSVSITAVSIAVLGYLTSLSIPKAKPHDPDLKISWNPVTQTLKNIKLSKKNRIVFLAILGDSWFWFYGAVFLAQIPNYSRLFLGASEYLVTILLAMFCIGVGAGALLCEKMSGHKIETGLVPFGSLGLTLSGIILYLIHPDPYTGEYVSLTQFLANSHNWGVLVCLLMMGIFGGFYIVPLYALIQYQSDNQHRSRIIAANNILNSLFMVIAAVYSILLLYMGLSIPQLFLVTAVVNAFVALYIYTLAPEFMVRFVTWFLIHLLYRVRTEGVEENIPETGPAVLICNHISFIDPLIIAAFVRRPVRFVMDHNIFHIPIIHFIFRVARAIPIATAKEDPIMKQRAFDAVAHALEKGELVVIFPEGMITHDGEMNRFKPGIEKVIKRTPAPVIPMALRGMWGSFFSRKNGRAMRTWPRRVWSKIDFVIGEPVPADQVSLAYLEGKVRTLRGDHQ